MKKSRVRSLSTTVLIGTTCLIAQTGCSLLYDLGTQQCNTTPDCRRMGPQFQNASCINHVCVAQPSAGGSGGLGGTGFGGTTSDVAGAAGTTTQEKCLNTKCPSGDGQHWICRSNRCIRLTNERCPIVIPKESAPTLLQQQDVIVIGGFATMANNTDFFDSRAIANWTLALNEFNAETSGGLPRYGSDGTQRPLVGLICKGDNVDTAHVIESVQHLTEVVEVPAILSTLSANQLYQAWLNQHPQGSTQRDVFFMSTGSADAQLANLQDNALVWHMLGDPRSLAAPLVTLLKQIEPVVNKRRSENFLKYGVDDPSVEPLRVTLVSSDEPILTDIANVLISTESAEHPGTTLHFNGKSWTENGENARWAQIQSGRQNVPRNVSPAIYELSARPPHVIVAMTGSEFPEFAMEDVEQLWRTGAEGTLHRVPPTYLMSHLSYNSLELLDVLKAHMIDELPLDMRLVGANYAQAQDARSKRLYDAYLARLKGSYLGELTLDGTENYYDGAYYLLYSIAAASATYKIPPGTAIAAGLVDRIIGRSPPAVSLDIGPTPLSTTLSMLSSGKAAYSLYGTMGAPNFDQLSGTRMSPMSAWCTRMNARGTGYEYLSDGLLFEPVTRTFSRPAAGVPGCLSQYCNSDADEGGAVCH